MAPKEGDLRVWWIPQIGAISAEEAFHVKVRTEEEGWLVIATLAQYDLYQFNKRVKPDYANTGGLERFEHGEWIGVDDD